MFNGYLLMLLLIIALSATQKSSKTKQFVVIACVVLIVFIGLRDVTRIGVDSRVNYPKHYRAMAHESFASIFSEGYRNVGLRSMMKICNDLHLSYQSFIFIEMAFAYIIFGRMIYKYSPSPVQSIICHCGLLYFFLFMDALKQCMAMAFLCLAFDGIIEKKPVKFLVLTGIGALFHTPALIFAPAYWIANQKNVKYYIIEVFAMFAIVFVFRGYFLNAMVDFYGATIKDSNRFLMNKVLIMLFIIGFSLVLRPITSNDKPYIQLLQLMGVAAVLQTFSAYSNNFERLADYYFQFSVLFIPMVFEKKDGIPLRYDRATTNSIKDITCLVSCVFFIWKFASTAGNAYYYTPYRFFW